MVPTPPRYSAPLFLVQLVARSELRFNNTLGVKYDVQLDSVAYDDDAFALQKQCAPESHLPPPSTRGLAKGVRNIGAPLRPENVRLCGHSTHRSMGTDAR